MSTRILRIIGLLAIVSAGLEIYTRLPSSAAVNELALPENTRYAVLLFHGTGGKDEPLLIEAAERIQAEIGRQDGVVVRHVVWSPWSDNRLRAGKNARTIGPAIGAELSNLPNLENIRLIAHSAGAYLLTPICRTYRENAADPAHIEMTYLDGMGIRGAWDYYYGYRHYGECADFSRGIFSMAQVPGTNAALQQSYSIDVTEDPSRSDVVSHQWPIEYFLNSITSDELEPSGRSHEQFPRGAIDIK